MEQKSGNGISVPAGVSIVAGIILGAGIFRTPQLVAGCCSNISAIMWMWIAGGAVSLIGALCYAELSSTYPSRGGDYHFLYRAYGSRVAFLFGWARLTVLQSGSIAILAFLAGDYLSQFIYLGRFSSTIYALVIIFSLSVVNAAGIKTGSLIQGLFFTAVITGLIIITLTGIILGQGARMSSVNIAPDPGSIGRAMIFVLLTYGGWNEAAYLSSEIRRIPGKNSINRVLFYSIGLVTAIYCIVNYAFLTGLGIDGVAGSEAVASDLMSQALGNGAAIFTGILVLFASISTANATIITGARSGYALGRDFAIFKFIDNWDNRRQTPVRALLLQGAIAAALVIAGSTTRSGFASMVEFTAPVFWFFFFLSGLSLFILRHKNSSLPRPFSVPLYPLTPILFCMICIYMLYASIVHTGIGSLIGIAVLLTGLPFLFFPNQFKTRRLYENYSRPY